MKTNRNNECKIKIVKKTQKRNSIYLQMARKLATDERIGEIRTQLNSSGRDEFSKKGGKDSVRVEERREWREIRAKK